MKPLIIANWKMNPQTEKEAKQLFDSVKKGVKNIKKAEVVICPPFVFLPKIKYQTSNIKLGAQNCFWEKKGAYTGEVSSIMLKGLGCQYIIVGHSERRKYFNETDEVVNKKLKSILDAKLSPILCIGETQEQKNKGETDRILRKQIEVALKGVSKATIQGVSRSARSSESNSPGSPLRVQQKQPFGKSASYSAKFCIAYEPIWAIGTGKPCNIEETQKVGLLIKKIISNFFNIKIAKKIRILYGGSVNSKNAEGYIREARLDGLLIGGASLKPNEFARIVKAV